MIEDVEKRVDELPSEWATMVKNYIAKVYENGRKQGIDEAVAKLTELHGKALAKHNYYANAAIEVRRLRKK